MNNLAVMTAGSVDDGKSTLLGRLLYDTNNLTTDQSEYLTELNNKFNAFIDNISFKFTII